MTRSNEPPTSRQLSIDDASEIDRHYNDDASSRALIDREPAPATLKLACIHISDGVLSSSLSLHYI
jgi:hypothetical protein